MSRRILTTTTSNFQGGLNLNADPFQLGKNETSDCLNVDLDPLGGFAQREGSSTYAYDADALWDWFNNGVMWSYVSPDGSVSQVMIQNRNTPQVISGGVGVDITMSTSPTTLSDDMQGAMFACVFRSPANYEFANCYIQRNAQYVPIKYDGGTGYRMTDAVGAWSEDFAAPTTDKMPLAKYITAHRNYVFVASTLESGTQHTSRIRFSHPGTAEAWRELDYIDVDPADGDQITGLASWNDRLLIFKNNAIFMLQGYDADTWEVVNISRSLGIPWQGACAIADDGVYFCSWPEGVYFFDGHRLHDIFLNLRPIMTDGTVWPIYSDMIHLNWVKQRLWMSVPTTQTNTTLGYNLVYDPALQGRHGGAWTRYNFQDTGLMNDTSGRVVGPIIEHNAGSNAPQWLGLLGGESYATTILKLHQDLLHDEVNGVPNVVYTKYQTPWIDVSNPALVKSWRRPVVVMVNEDTYTMRLTAYTDYSMQSPKWTSPLTVGAASSGSMVWGTDAWGSGTWGAPEGWAMRIVKAPRIGRATAVSLAFEGPKTTTGEAIWGVSAITWKYIPKRIRS